MICKKQDNRYEFLSQLILKYNMFVDDLMLVQQLSENELRRFIYILDNYYGCYWTSMARVGKKIILRNSSQKYTKEM